MGTAKETSIWPDGDGEVEDCSGRYRSAVPCRTDYAGVPAAAV